MRTQPFQRFLEFVQYPLWLSEPAPDAPGDVRVTLLDLRFGTPREIGFAAYAVAGPNAAVKDSFFSMAGFKPR